MLQKKNHRRYNPLLDEWVIVASNRVSRPWQGNRIDAPSFMPTNETNSLAPGGKRLNNVVRVITPWYKSTYVFDNDFPTFTDNMDEEDSASEELFRQMAVSGICRVICYHPDTRKSIATMTLDEIFENRGAAVGCSNAHPHGQLWAGNFLPSLPSRKDKCQRAYYSRHGRPMLMDVLQKEKANENERIVLQNDHWTVLVPYWACPFPFSMGWLGAPTGPSLYDDNKCWQLHASFHPPLLRSGCIL
uniref:UDP-glucose--hexose-1-phosphate uridylyltransferase n=1 Tax=Angiostrongylus cantonensis TaxID=6313 RepID=A0A158P9B7_ANGCA